MDTCGKCIYAKVLPSNMTQRMCYGDPPNVLIFPAANKEGFEVRAARPVVGADDRACSKFKERDTRLEAPTSEVHRQ